ncbi:MAG TPA: TonB-dependent receptor, partial [Longimicrobiales bacterium]|nr:TonB-dependent receptor [Longimicrobiales bacterium]
MRRIALLLTWALFVWATGPRILEAQQTGTLGGRVITEGGQPLAGAQVALEGTSLGSLTNRSGRYLILNVPAGDYTVRVESMGYSTVSAQVSVAAGQVTTQDFQLGEEAVALEELRVTVGSRAAHTAADELPVPVDVFPEAKLAEQNIFDFLGTIEQIAPSIYVPQEQISDLASGLRPFQLRGMSPDQALVLINGKRRHKTASVMVFGNSSPGSSGVDLNAIPTMAIGQVEILRDGASAQYGSDAIAGVLNLGLKNNVSPLTIEAGTGKYFPDDFPNDGWRGRIAANWGFELFDGVLNVTGEYQRRTPTERAGVDPRDQLVCGDQPAA